MSGSVTGTGMERVAENKAANKTKEVMRVQRGEGDKVNCVPNHCQTVGIKPENLSINLN